MDIVIKMNRGDEVFDGDEIARMLHKLADRISVTTVHAGDVFNISDLNGNTAGTMEVV